MILGYLRIPDACYGTDATCNFPRILTCGSLKSRCQSANQLMKEAYAQPVETSICLFCLDRKYIYIYIFFKFGVVIFNWKFLVSRNHIVRTLLLPFFNASSWSTRYTCICFRYFCRCRGGLRFSTRILGTIMRSGASRSRTEKRWPLRKQLGSVSHERGGDIVHSSWGRCWHVFSEQKGHRA